MKKAAWLAGILAVACGCSAVNRRYDGAPAIQTASAAKTDGAEKSAAASETDKSKPLSWWPTKSPFASPSATAKVTVVAAESTSVQAHLSRDTGDTSASKPLLPSITEALASAAMGNQGPAVKGQGSDGASMSSKPEATAGSQGSEVRGQRSEGPLMLSKPEATAGLPSSSRPRARIIDVVQVPSITQAEAPPAGIAPVAATVIPAASPVASRMKIPAPAGTVSASPYMPSRANAGRPRVIDVVEAPSASRNNAEAGPQPTPLPVAPPADQAIGLPLSHLGDRPASDRVTAATNHQQSSRNDMIVHQETEDTLKRASATAAHAFSDASGPGGDHFRAVNSRRISLDYTMKDVGPSGVAEIDLWYTRDGRTWQKHSSGRQVAPPFVAELPADDLYGLTLVVHSGAGVARIPQEGEAPQVWVEVDSTAPEVRLLGVDTGAHGAEQELRVLWRATDKNLEARPITIVCAAQPEGPWTALAANLENTGRFACSLPPGLPDRFFVRVQAADRAGNIGMAQTLQAVLRDSSQPTAAITGIRPESK